MKQQNKKRIFGTILAMAVIGLLIGVILYRTWETKKEIHVIYIAKGTLESDFWSSVSEGAEVAANEADAKLSVLTPESEGDIEGQNKQIAQAIAQKPDVIALVPMDYEKSIAAAKEITDSGIKLVLMDSRMKETTAASEIMTDNVSAGRELGRYATTICGKSPVIGIVNHVQGASTAIEREQGFKDGLGNLKEQVVDTVYSDSQYDQAYQQTLRLLKDYPDITLLAGMNEFSAVGAARAIKDLKLAGKVKIVGFDNSIEEIQFLESGVIDAIVIQKPFEMGYMGIKTAIETEKNEKVERKIDSGSTLITRDNMYEEENQKLLFPFREKQQ